MRKGRRDHGSVNSSTIFDNGCQISGVGVKMTVAIVDGCAAGAYSAGVTIRLRSKTGCPNSGSTLMSELEGFSGEGSA